jgi:hypothetical protein
MGWEKYGKGYTEDGVFERGSRASVLLNNI